MELRVLRYFLAVAREGNITGAANFLHLTQPTLSRQIRDLEEELGQQLLTRKSHRVVLTPEGMLLRKRAEEIIAMVDKTESEFTSMSDSLSGDIYIGGGETQAVRQIAELINKLRDEFPGIHYHLHRGNAEDATERLDKGLLDFGIIIQPADITKYDYLNLCEKKTWGVDIRKDSPLAEKNCIKKEDLLELPLICSRQVLSPHRSKNGFADWFGADFDKLDIVATYNLLYNAAIMVEAGVGYAVTLDRLVNTSANSSLCFRPLTPTLESGLSIIWKKYQVFSPAAEFILNRVKETHADEILTNSEHSRQTDVN